MIIDTKNEASALQKTKGIVVIFYIVPLVVTAFFLPLEPTLKWVIYGAFSVLYLCFFWFQYNMKYSYFYFSNNGKNLVFKFYSLRIFSGKPQTIEISKLNFVKYELISEFFNKRTSLVLFQKTPKGIAKYPPISLTLLSKTQKKDLLNVLSAASP